MRIINARRINQVPTFDPSTMSSAFVQPSLEEYATTSTTSTTTMVLCIRNNCCRFVKEPWRHSAHGSIVGIIH